MTRKFKTIADAVPREYPVKMHDDCSFDIEWFFTAAETAQLMRVYGHAWFIYQMCERNLYRDGSRADYWYCILRDKASMRIAEIKAKMAEWEKDSKEVKSGN